MRILIVGSDDIYAIENFYAKYIRQCGHNVDIFNAQVIFYKFYYKNILNKFLFKLGISRVYKRINILFKNKVKETNPDIVFIFKGMEITPESLIWLDKLGIKKVNFNPDNPFVFTGPGSGNKNVTNSISLYELHFTYNTTVMQKMRSFYKIPVQHLPFGFDLDASVFNKYTGEKEVMKVGFVGNPDKERAGFLEDLANQGIAIDIYGNHWKNFVNHKNITVKYAVKEAEFWKVLHKYRVQLNLMRIHNLESHNMRSFEVPGVGGMMLAPDTEEHRKFFEPGVEVFLFTDLNDCIRKIHLMLNLPKEEADNIRKNARTKSINAGYTYKDRAHQALKSLEQLYNEK